MESQTAHELRAVGSVHPIARAVIVNLVKLFRRAQQFDGGKCYLCGCPGVKVSDNRDHQISTSQGGMTTSRTIAIGDIHGCRDPFEQLLTALEIAVEDTIVILGDVLDRGPDSRGALELVMGLQHRCQLVTILGNHEEMLLDVADGRMVLQDWIVHGGGETLDSYGKGCTLSCIPPAHIEFIRTWGDYYETASNFYAHGNYLAREPLDKQPWEMMRWESLRNFQPEMHCSGKTAILGHTSQKQGGILNLGYLVCIDSYCHGGGWLTALEPETGNMWQTNIRGEFREGRLPSPRL
jgi:serine/threonine protein phosphatase 1